jgi:hypothetical protein
MQHIGNAEVGKLPQILERGHVSQYRDLVFACLVDVGRADLGCDLRSTATTAFHPDLDEIDLLVRERTHGPASFLRTGWPIDLGADPGRSLWMGETVAARIDTWTGQLAVSEIVHRRYRFG